jgi:Alw26I/Eco31I/Esp3I family type II restriction m6 adenine DNA methyltransferase
MTKIHQQPSIISMDHIAVKRGELDLTLDKDCITTEPTEYILIRGSNVTRYSLIEHSKKETEYVDIDRFRKKLGKSVRAEHIKQPRLACQQISNRTQRWRLKFAIVPPDVVLANSCNYIVLPKKSGKSHYLFLLGLLNSELLNWRFSLTNTNNHVSTRELTQLPISDSTSPEFRKLRSAMISEARKVKGNGISPKIEAISFSLYGFSENDAKSVLRARLTPKTETAMILDELAAFTN